jgi:signal transduction histidine kinase
MTEPLTLDDVIVNSEFAHRASRPPDFAAESEALEELAQTMTDSPAAILKKLAEIALQLCSADSAGISLLEKTNGKEVFRWNAIAGVLSDRVNGTMPRDASPCGTTIDRNATLLMYLPDRFFPALRAEPPIVEVLLIPFHLDNKPIGTVWIVAHTHTRKFEREDERLVKNLTRFTTAAWQLWMAKQNAEAATIAEHALTTKSAVENEALQDQVNKGRRREEDLQALNTALSADMMQSTADLAAANEGLRRGNEERNKLQEQLHQSQKMERLGSLVGGIAHDFNNLLHVLQGYVTMMRKDLRDAIKLEEWVQAIDESIKEGTSLTQQLLTVARKNKVKFESTDINRLVANMAKWLKRTLPKTITFNVNLDPGIPRIRADATQLNQVLLNLCLNAKDAMSESGNLRLSTTVVTGISLQDRFPSVEEHNYICIAVADTGMGIDEDTRERLFEPFFTTKEQEKGTGLGLSIVYSIVKSHDGFVEVNSEPGQGATFSIYLPVTS